MRAAVERRIAAWTLTPVWNAEGFQVLRYHESQKYDAVSTEPPKFSLPAPTAPTPRNSAMLATLFEPPCCCD